ncbi:hypothetical protein [Pelagicoccus albus]|uniref:Uncharacterized protein n=1 Tax=Pelagicoccus albus TaxID=415222 RepID=A0A7X1B5Q3_9BACT|nr:hypothetical protein [Pelagicoccus albus]MBC2605859.1 hypothetical protein [Pelagicoccus albus]
MRVEVLAALFLLSSLLAACSPKPERKVAGSEWLEAERGGSSYDVLAYPLTEDELVWFESSLPILETIAREHSSEWAHISESEDPSEAAQQGVFWKRSGVLGSDVMSVMLKLTFLQEFSDADETVETDMRENLAWLEKRMEGGEAKQELLEMADSIRSILTVLEAHREAKAFQFYLQNKVRMDAALDRFLAVGEQ